MKGIEILFRSFFILFVFGVVTRKQYSNDIVSVKLSFMICGKRLLLMLLNSMMKHSHKKKYNLETYEWLLFMLLQDFFVSDWCHRMLKKKFPKSVAHYSYYSKINNIIVQMETTNIEKQFYPWLTLFFLTQNFLVQS